MRRRLVPTGNESLDLLLDTICNTFGGIIFISLLVVILLNTTSKEICSTPPTQQSQTALIKSDIQRERLARELSDLKSAFAQQQEIVSSIASEEVLLAAREAGRLQKEHSRQLLAKSKTIGDITATQKRINRLAQDKSDRNSNLSAATSRKKDVKRQFDMEVAQRSRTAVIPKLVETTLPKRIYFLKRGRLHGPVYLATGEINAVDFVESIQLGQKTIEATSSGGVAVDVTGANFEQLASKYQGIQSATHVIQIFVWADSFEHFESVRLATQSAGLKYELTPCERNTIIRIGVPSPTKRTQVQ